MSPDTLAIATENLRDAPVPAGPPPESMDAAERIAASAVRRRPWAPRLSWAAGVLIAGGVAAYLLIQRSATLVFADVVQSVRQTHTVEGTVTLGPETMRMWVRGNQLRAEAKMAGQDAVQVMDLSTGTALSLDVAKHAAQIVNGQPMPYDVYGFFAGLHGKNDGKPFGERTINGRRAQGFNVTGKMPGAPELPLTVWVDSATRLPVEIQASLGLVTAVAHDMRFDEPLDDRLFSLTPPEGYRLAESRATRYAGRVTDEQGKPLAGVDVSLTDRAYYIHSRAGGPGEPVKTDADGRFSIAGQDPPDADGTGLTEPNVRLEFRRSDLLYARVEDVHLFPPEQRADLRVRLGRGASLSGTVVDPAGHPIAGVRVRAVFGVIGVPRADPETRDEYLKAAVTDPAGRFELRGLAPGKAAIGAFQAGGDGPILCGRVNVDLAKPAAPVRITVRPLELPPGAFVHDLLGMRLTDVTPALHAALLLSEDRGVLVLSPGPNGHRLFRVGQPPRAGDVIWMANERIDGYRDLVGRVAAATAGQRTAGASSGTCHIVSDVTRDDGSEGSSGTIVILTADDMAAVARAAAAAHD